MMHLFWTVPGGNWHIHLLTLGQTLQTMIIEKLKGNIVSVMWCSTPCDDCRLLMSSRRIYLLHLVCLYIFTDLGHLSSLCTFLSIAKQTNFVRVNHFLKIQFNSVLFIEHISSTRQTQCALHWFKTIKYKTEKKQEIQWSTSPALMDPCHVIILIIINQIIRHHVWLFTKAACLDVECVVLPVHLNVLQFDVKNCSLHISTGTVCSCLCTCLCTWLCTWLCTCGGTLYTHLCACV